MIPGDPAWFPVLLDVERGEIGFVKTDREALSSAPFLDHRFASPAGAQRVPLGAVSGTVDAAGTVPPPCIFHTAFCCSTLLAAALDAPGRVLALKEPDVLMQLANARRVATPWQHDDERFAGLVALVTHLLARRFDVRECVLLKPTNAAGNLLPWTVALGGRAVILHAGLREFLVSVIKKGEAGRWFVRHLLNIFRLDRADIDAWPDRERMLLTDLQVAALVWQLQMEAYGAVLAAPAARGLVATLDAAVLLEHPAEALAAVNAFLRLGLDARQLAAAATGPDFSRHAKFSDQAYDSVVRAAERAQVEAVHGEAIETTLTWAARLRGGAPAPDFSASALTVTG